jgi:DNA-binding response OmpR family regulator
MRLLIVEDNNDILANLADYLQSEGYVVDCAPNGLLGLHLAATEHYDLIVLDLMLPGLDGLSLCQRIRQSEKADVPIIMLTARDTLDDRLQGFDCGADDYLTKPFALPELAARIKAVLRRAQSLATQELCVADLRYNTNTLNITRGGMPLQIGPIGLKLLEVLMRKSPSVVRRASLEDAIWAGSPPDSDSLRSHIHALRQQVDRPFSQPLIHTVHGIGYQLCCPNNE